MDDNAVEQSTVNLPNQAEPPIIEGDEFAVSFGEVLSDTLDLSTWERGENLASLYSRLEQEIEQAVEQESRIRERVRREVFPRLRTRPGAPANAGVFATNVHGIEKVHRGLLFNGQVEACDGTSVPFDTLPVTIVQIGVCLVSYRGDQGSWVHRLYRRDLRVGGLDPVEETIRILDERRKRAGYDQSSKKDTLTDLARRGIMTYAERAVLMNMAEARWRMGHGNPAPYELLTGSGMSELLAKSLTLLSNLIDHKYFVFVPSSPGDRMLLTLGDALRPMEYAIVDTLEPDIDRIARGHYRGDWAGLVNDVKQFGKDRGSKIVKGVYRASSISPAQLFYAHVDHAHEAAMIAMADSVLQDHRGFPMLIDLADNLCRATFGRETLTAPAQTVYADSGEGFRFLPERQTRR